MAKTMILREYAARNRDAVLIEADPGYTARTLLEELCRQLGVKVRGNIHELIDACVRELRDSGRPADGLTRLNCSPIGHWRFCAVCMTSGYRGCPGGYASPSD
ncbi:hypothetical protein [Escherichia coli]|uniref:hypothetical protein n=1 Tax=Escherichia coli TaxID=562 RepID=UPI0039A4A218